MIVYISCN